MSSHVGASGVNVSSRVGGRGTEDASEENSNGETYTPCFKAVRPMLRSADPAGEGRSSTVEHLVRPALPGRKAHRKTCSEDNRGRWRDGNEERDEERQYAEHVGGKERGKQRQRKTGRTETCGDGAQESQGRGSTESLSSSNSDIQLNSALEVGEGSNNLQRGHTCPRPHSIGFSRTNTTNLNAQSPRPAMRSMSSPLPQPPIQSRSTPLSPQRLSSRTAAGDRYPFSSPRELDPFWMEVRTGAATGRPSQSHHTQTRIPSLTSSELGEEEEEEEEDEEEEEEEEEDVEDGEEEGSGVMEVMSQTMTPAVVPPCVPFGERRMSKREKNRIKCLRRRQRRRERWRQSQLQESRQSSTGNPSSSSSEDDEDVSAGDREGYICAVCLDVYFSPYMCHPCNHIFCEPCLRTLAKNSPTNTPCPLCRTIITHVFFQKELNQTARTFFPKEYLSRKQNFQKASCAKWPLPSCRKLFRIFGGFQRQSSPIARRQFPHGGGYRLDAMDFEDDSRGWRFDMDMVIIYIYSVNWVIGFFIFCFLCYLFFPSF
ncbi:E3 ubiquitin-protein ligase RNF180 isoform X1 [Seriola lalandi dorsalis]|uniref:E3 ubiquitin-protein ligase RNF180 isoform X1 n=1 Tax=Seriola lalandi dorsalis TaxID=1841481 RepID=UPI000C6F6581|nr:E3 ubiquitin-protein ligase RNF180 isoform X1 [Seriola lalandi dorsalis]